jgi:hypothetical protein
MSLQMCLLALAQVQGWISYFATGPVIPDTASDMALPVLSLKLLSSQRLMKAPMV